MIYLRWHCEECDYAETRNYDTREDAERDDGREDGAECPRHGARYMIAGEVTNQEG